MGNNQTRELGVRDGDSTHGYGRARRHTDYPEDGAPGDRLTAPSHSSRNARGSRTDLSFLGIGSSSNPDPPLEPRRETRQEREARKLAKEREAREKERERSMREEHVDGGFLVTQGVYTGTEDFNKAIVRRLMIERRMAPFWRGLNDFKEEWVEHQLVAAARGLPVPAADEIPLQDAEGPQSLESTPPTTSQNLAVPISSRSQSYASDASANLSPSHPALSSPPPPSPAALSSSPTSVFRPRSKTLASLATSFKNSQQADIEPREIQLPKDPYVNGIAMEAFLYKDSAECPICIIYYPPYLNKTRCCDQPICSECFVQIKRPEPHLPEHEHPDPSHPATPARQDLAESDALVSEPANCPYCQQSEFGITFEPPPFRRGLVYANSVHGHTLGAGTPAMSSTSSLNSVGSPSLEPRRPGRRRTTSVSANDSSVITTDRIRPDWATKLANARNHAARRSAAATALHTAAYLMGNSVGGDRNTFGFGGRRRFGRSRGNTGRSGGSDSATPPPGAGLGIDEGIQAVQPLDEQSQRDGHSAGDGGEETDRRRTRMDDLEDMMMMEAIRLSIAAEDERKKKEEKAAAKAAAKEAKKKERKEKEDRKRERKMYSHSASGSGSALSLSLPGVGRRRGNSGSSVLLQQATMNNADKGKTVDRGISPSRTGLSSIPVPGAGGKSTTSTTAVSPHIDAIQTLPTTATAPEKRSHLRQMSSASSPASSFIESVPGSVRNGFHGSNSSLESPNASGTHLGEITPEIESNSGTPSATEPMFNFRSLAAMIGREEENEKDDGAEHIEHSRDHSGSTSEQFGEHSRGAQNGSDEHDDLEMSVATLRLDSTVVQLEQSNGKLSIPSLTVTPGTPRTAALKKDEESKQLGAETNYEVGNGRNFVQ